MGFFARYEAESPLNVLTYPVEGVVNEGDGACPGVPGTPSDGVKEGTNCASGGEVVNQILGRSPCTPPTSTTSYTDCGNLGGGVTFNDVTVPVDGVYYVTWWYHSGGGGGQADTYGDANCGGVHYDVGPGSGCRPHLIFVNGAQMSSTVGGQTAVYYEFPAYPTSWSLLHGAVTALPLKAGFEHDLHQGPRLHDLRRGGHRRARRPALGRGRSAVPTVRRRPGAGAADRAYHARSELELMRLARRSAHGARRPTARAPSWIVNRGPP